MSNADLWTVVSAVGTAFAAIVALIVFRYEKRKNKFNIIEQSFDVLQRLNEKALESDANLVAAIRSGNMEDSTSADDARIIYFHYMRINRMYRVFEYKNGKYISEEEADRIINPYLGTLRPLLPDKLVLILKRGYPDDFARYLIKKVESSSPLPPITKPEIEN